VIARPGGLAFDDRGVSDVVGYVLVFSLITASVGVVTVVGFEAIDDRQEAERINNVERAFDVFAANVDNVYRDGAPGRATEMRLAGGSLGVGESVVITIEASNGDNVTVPTNPLVYRDGDTEIVYTAGALLRSEGDSSVMLQNPPFRTDTPTASFPIVDTYVSSGPTTVSSDGTIRVASAARGVNTTVPSSFGSPGAYNVTVESSRSDAWARYFDSQPNANVLVRESDRVVAEVSTDGIVAPRFPVRLRFSQ
jgi:hypothetical protein